MDFLDRIKAADSELASYAVKNGEGLGRVYEEKASTSRFRFQRDRGRIVHTEAFRRLKSKTQVFVGGGGDHYRTRLTHTMEVAGISRDIARFLNANEDLAECIALAHDLGHPPFGHAGEEALSEWLKQFDKSFEHNIQSHRIVTALEQHTLLYKGLNLNQEVLDGLLKHSTPHDHPKGVLIDRSPSIEAQIVNLADEITYTAHDSEDGLDAKLFTIQEITKIPLAKEANDQTKARGTSLRGAIIDLLVRDLYQNKNMTDALQRISTIEDVYSLDNSIVIFSEKMRAQLNGLREFLWNNMYYHPLVRKHSLAGQQIIESLCNHLYANPTDKITARLGDSADSLEQAVTDYVSGMTDSYAFFQAAKMNLLSDEAATTLSYDSKAS